MTCLEEVRVPRAGAVREWDEQKPALRWGILSGGKERGEVALKSKDKSKARGIPLPGVSRKQ